MNELLSYEDRPVPPRALVLSLGALLVPVVGALAFPERLGEAGALLWLLALVPAFLLSYYRGWRGVATALATGMAILSLTQVVATLLGRSIPDLLFWIVVVYLGVCVGIGWVTELLHRERDEVEDLALTDILTHLPNRRHARAFLEAEFGAAERGRVLSVVLFDLDDFKSYNDRHGHQAGDEVLQAFADILRSNTRRMNLSCRFGGEEFLTILAGSDVEGALVFAERVRDGLAARSLPHGPLTVSGGVAAYHPSMRSPDELIAAADLALYRAKNDGRDCIRTFGRPLDVVEPEPGLDRDQAVREVHPAGPPSDYPRSDEEIGRSRPPLTLLPHQVTGFGEGRRALVVDDEASVRHIICKYLAREGFSVTEGENVEEGHAALSGEFDVVIADIRLPGASGNELVTRVKARWPATQVIVITGLRDARIAAEAVKAGADSYLFKPFGMPELQAHLVDALSRRDRVLGERSRRQRLSEKERRRAEEAREAVVTGARALVRAAEARDPYTRGHAARVAEYALLLADTLDVDASEVDREALRLACELHDIGKIEVPDSVLNKEGPLADQELLEVRKHPATGRRILEPLLDDELVLWVTAWHHERWDGTGYPDGLAGEAIPLPARLVAVADALEAMTSDRAYRPALSWDEALRQIRDGSGTHFDPSLVGSLDEALPALRRLHETLVQDASQ